MITIFNRREVALTYSMDEQARIRENLSANGIDYKYRVIDITDHDVTVSKRAKAGSLGYNLNYTKEYAIYVHKKDYEAAKSLIERGR